MNIFEHSLTRIAGGRLHLLHQMVLPAPLQEQAAQLRSHAATLEAMRQELTDALFEFIKLQSDNKVQNKLQNFRRDVFNKRPLKDKAWDEALALVSGDTAALLHNWRSGLQQLAQQKQNWQQTYRSFLLGSRHLFSNICNDEKLKNGLLLSSHDLLNSLEAHLAKDPETFRNKDLRTEQGLLKYVTRMYAKTSPFSTYTQLALTHHRDIPGGIMHISPAGGKGYVSSFRLNTSLQKYLKDLLSHYRDFYLQMPLQLNPTLQTEGNRYHFLTNFNNVESFQRMQASGVLQLLFEYLDDPASDHSFAALLQYFAENVEAPAEELENYIKQLLSFGFIEYNWGISGLDAGWLTRFISLLNQYPANEPLQLLRQNLQQIQTILHSLRDAGTNERKAALDNIHQLFREGVLRVHEAAGLPERERWSKEKIIEEYRKDVERIKALQEKAAAEKENKTPEETTQTVEEIAAASQQIFKKDSPTYFFSHPWQMLYEDTVYPEPVALDKTGLQSYLQLLNTALEVLYLFDYATADMDKMHEYYKQKYANATEVPLLAFYEEYFRDVKKPEDEFEERKKRLQQKQAEARKQPGAEIPEDEFVKNYQPFVTPEQDKIALQREKWIARLAELIQPDITATATEVNVPLDALLQVNKDLELNSSYHRNYSLGCFTQFFKGSNGSMNGMLNACFMGYGKLLGRFLYLFNDEITTDLNTWNRDSFKDDNILMAECTDASYFNANLHPSLLSYEIKTPGGNHTLDAAHQLAVRDIVVSRKEDLNSLILIHAPTGKQVLAFDLGFQQSNGRSKLFNLMQNFCMARLSPLYPIGQAVNSIIAKYMTPETTKDRKIFAYPRIWLNNQLVVQRRHWLIHKSLLPRLEDGEDFSDYFLKVQEWRKQIGLPDEVFVMINTDRFADLSALNINNDGPVKLGRDDYKPQYIHFNNPILLEYMEKMLQKVSYFMRIDEMLPSSEQLNGEPGNQFVTETIIQWNN
jgi:lantibiotic biosynthesis protein